MTMVYSLGFFTAACVLLGFVALVDLLMYVQKRIRIAHTMFRKAQNELDTVKQTIDTEKREATIKLKDEMHRKRKEFDLELKRERLELERLQAKLNGKFEALEKKEEQFDEIRRELQHKERELSRVEDSMRSSEAKLKTLYNELIGKLERISNMSRDEAKQTLLDTLLDEVRLASQKFIQKTEEEAKQTAKTKAVDLVVTAMQRYTADQVAAHSSGVVHLPNDEMKGRIIGKEGRNIKALEVATGMEFVIGDTPELITISGFHPIRREVAKRSLEKLIADGRINPTRIEETVAQCEAEIE